MFCQKILSTVSRVDIKLVGIRVVCGKKRESSDCERLSVIGKSV